MVRLNELRIGNHVLCGSIAEYIPKAVREVGAVRHDVMATRVDAEHPEFDEYTPAEIDGLEITGAMLTAQGWQQSKLSTTRYIYADAENKERFVWDASTKTATISAVELIERTGCIYLHQLENAIYDSKSEYRFML
jgi:hypothetical protein